MPTSVWDQGWLRICLSMLLRRGNEQIMREQNAVEGGISEFLNLYETKKVVQLLIPASVWDQSCIRICLYIRLRGDGQKKRDRLGVEDVMRSLKTFEVVPYQSPTVQSQPEQAFMYTYKYKHTRAPRLKPPPPQTKSRPTGPLLVDWY
eukprot:scaffold48881_cov62-Attheya_sp.AAC.12